MLLDTSGLLAAMFIDQRRHEECANIVLAARPPLILSPFVLAELDYLILKHAGVSTELQMLREVARGAYELAEFTAGDIEKATEILNKYRALEIGIADASIVVLAERYGTRDVLTLDERHFRALRIGKRKAFRILPADL